MANSRALPRGLLRKVTHFPFSGGHHARTPSRPCTAVPPPRHLHLVALSPASGTAKTIGEASHHPPPAPDGPGVVLAWEEHAFAAVYPAYPAPLAPSIPGGVPVLGFTSLTMYDAVRASQRRHHSSETAAAATAAHDVLVHYAPLLHNNPAAPEVAAQVVSTLDMQLEGDADWACPTARRRQGCPDRRPRRVELHRRPQGDHFRDGSIHYSKPKLPGLLAAHAAAHGHAGGLARLARHRGARPARPRRRPGRLTATTTHGTTTR